MLNRIPPMLPTIVVTIVILYLTLYPDPVPSDMMPLFPYADKVVHLLMFLGMGGCLLFDLGRIDKIVVGLKLLICCVLIASLFGGLIELLQGMMAMGRSCDVYDWLADSVGAIVGVALSYFVFFSNSMLGANGQRKRNKEKGKE